MIVEVDGMANDEPPWWATPPSAHQPQTPATSTYSADLAWGQPSPGLTSPRTLSSTSSAHGRCLKQCSIMELRDAVQEVARDICQAHGGQIRYLETRYEDRAARDAYAKTLWLYLGG